MKEFPFRIGTTSYIIPDDILPNARFLAGKVDDIELVLFEVEDGGSNLPDEAAIAELKKLTDEYGMSYTIHLPLDLKLGAGDEDRRHSIEKALSVISCTSPLRPYAYVLHLDGREVITEFHSRDWQRWRERSIEALDQLAANVDGPHLHAIENLDGYPPRFWDDILEKVPVSRCIDIGHLWRDGHDPMPYLEDWIERTRVLHMHGCSQRDHQSLTHVPPRELQRILKFLLDCDYQGILTIEVFGQEDFESSLAALLDAMRELPQIKQATEQGIEQEV